MTTATVNNALLLANINEVVSAVIKNIAGNDISNTLNSSKITNETICFIVNDRISKVVK